MKNVSLFKHVNASLNPYRWAISLLVAVMISGLFAVLSLMGRLDADRKVALSIAPYLETLVASSDRPEILRALQSISQTNNEKLILVQDGLVFATSGDVTELDRPFVKPETKLRLWDMDFGNNEIITASKINGSSTIHVISPLMPSIRGTVGIFAFVFVVSILISLFSARQMRRAIKKALQPMNQLHAEIKGLVNGDEQNSSPIQIRELEEIRATVVTTKVALENAKDQLAESKAKKMSSVAYKRLIHDLHNPVASLRQYVILANDEGQNNETKIEAAIGVTRLADQILNQVTAAKKNLEEEPIALRELNVIECIQDSVRQVKSLGNQKNITTDFDSEFLNVPHDPALLKRAIVNLLENGIEAAKSQVRVSVLKNSDLAIIRVSDDGDGMDENRVSVYLQGRGQSGKANRQAFGLSSTNHIVRSHGGKLIYKRSDLGGASFEIRLGVV